MSRPTATDFLDRIVTDFLDRKHNGRGCKRFLDSPVDGDDDEKDATAHVEKKSRRVELSISYTSHKAPQPFPVSQSVAMQDEKDDKWRYALVPYVAPMERDALKWKAALGRLLVYPPTKGLIRPPGTHFYKNSVFGSWALDENDQKLGPVLAFTDQLQSIELQEWEHRPFIRPECLFCGVITRSAVHAVVIEPDPGVNRDVPHNLHTLCHRCISKHRMLPHLSPRFEYTLYVSVRDDSDSKQKTESECRAFTWSGLLVQLWTRTQLLRVFDDSFKGDLHIGVFVRPICNPKTGVYTQLGGELLGSRHGIVDQLYRQCHSLSRYALYRRGRMFPQGIIDHDARYQFLAPAGTRPRTTDPLLIVLSAAPPPDPVTMFFWISHMRGVLGRYFLSYSNRRLFCIAAIRVAFHEFYTVPDFPLDVTALIADYNTTLPVEFNLSELTCYDHATISADAVVHVRHRNLRDKFCWQTYTTCHPIRQIERTWGVLFGSGDDLLFGSLWDADTTTPDAVMVAVGNSKYLCREENKTSACAIGLTLQGCPHNCQDVHAFITVIVGPETHISGPSTDDVNIRVRSPSAAVVGVAVRTEPGELPRFAYCYDDSEGGVRYEWITHPNLYSLIKFHQWPENTIENWFPFITSSTVVGHSMQLFEDGPFSKPMAPRPVGCPQPVVKLIHKSSNFFDWMKQEPPSVPQLAKPRPYRLFGDSGSDDDVEDEAAPPDGAIAAPTLGEEVLADFHAAMHGLWKRCEPLYVNESD